jgi:hypothetical protein
MPPREETMSSIPTPQLPLYRITLFYGPEAMTEPPSQQVCIFNVKKRSWKGGAQIAVEVGDAQVASIKQRIGFDVWLKEIVRALPSTEREDSESRARDLLVQEICSLKLSLTLATDIRQENSRVESDRFVAEVDRMVVEHGDRIKTNILTELDIPAT